MAALCNVRVGRLYSVYSQVLYIHKQETSSGSPPTSCLYTTQVFSVDSRVEQCGRVADIGPVCTYFYHSSTPPPPCLYLNVYKY